MKAFDQSENVLQSGHVIKRIFVDNFQHLDIYHLLLGKKWSLDFQSVPSCADVTKHCSIKQATKHMPNPT